MSSKMKQKKIHHKLLNKIRGEAVHKEIKICVDCGSTKISINGKHIACKECGSSHRFAKEHISFKFHPGDLVQIIDSDKGASIIYKIAKISKDSDGIIHYTLKSKSSPITLFYHENSDSFLEKVTSR